MKKTTILWLVGISAFALQCLLVGLSFASVCPMSAAVNFACGLLPLVFVPVLCPLIYRHGSQSLEPPPDLSALEPHFLGRGYCRSGMSGLY